MKKILGFIVLTLILCTNAYSDPVLYVDNWNLLDKFYTKKLAKISVKDNKVLFNKKKIFTLDNSAFDIYETDNLIFIYNIDKNILYSINSNSFKVTETKLEFGILKAIVKDCDKVDLWISGKIPNNAFVFKWASIERPKDFKCSYFIFGGRCNLIINQQGESTSYDKAILNQNFNYEGDVSDLKYILDDNNQCSFYNKIKIN